MIDLDYKVVSLGGKHFASPYIDPIQYRGESTRSYCQLEGDEIYQAGRVESFIYSQLSEFDPREICLRCLECILDEMKVK